MSLDRIYNHISKMEKSGYYVELAKKEIMLVPALLDCVADNCMILYWAENILEEIGKHHPELLYPYFDYMVELMNKEKGLALWQLWRIITKVLVCDSDNKWIGIRDKYYELLMSENITEFSVACDCAADIVKVYSEEEKPIREALASVDSREFENGDVTLEALRQVSSEKAKETLEALDGKQ